MILSEEASALHAPWQKYKLQKNNFKAYAHTAASDFIHSKTERSEKNITSDKHDDGTQK